MLNLDSRKLAENTHQMPDLPALKAGGGFTVDMWTRKNSMNPGQIILDTRNADNKGIAIRYTDDEEVNIALSDGTRTASWSSDPGTVSADKSHHVAIIIDGGPKIISFVIDGILCDGGSHRQYGWSRFDPDLDDVNTAEYLKITDSSLLSIKIYNRYLRTSEAISNYHAGLE